MKRFAFRLVILATLLVLILPVGSLAAATGPVNSFARPDVAQRVYLPMIGKNTSFLPPIIPETTNVLDAATTQHLAAVSPDGATYTFDQNTAALQKLAPGEIMVSAPTDLMPYGFLRQVAAINLLAAKSWCKRSRRRWRTRFSRGRSSLIRNFQQQACRHKKSLRE